ELHALWRIDFLHLRLRYSGNLDTSTQARFVDSRSSAIDLRRKQLMLAHAAHSIPAAFLFFQDQQVGFDIISLWHQMGLLAKVVVGILFVMSGWSFGVMIDRWMAFNAARKQSRAFAPAVAGALRDGKIDEAIKVAERNKRSHLAKVVTAGLMEFRAHQDSSDIPGETIEASKRALERTEAIVHAELKRGLGSLATIGSTSPFVGLFGTVVGIINAFREITTQRQTGIGAVAGGISEALVTTAIGLAVAIPAVMMFNYLTGRVEAFDVEMDNSSSELIDYFLKRRGAVRR